VKTILWLTFLSLLSPLGAFAQTTPGFTQGSMNSTTTTEQTVTETIAIEKFGGAYSSITGHNVTPSAAIGETGTTYSMNTDATNWQLEIVTRAAGVIETQDIERTIETTSTTTSLSVFSQ
jgi:hypothetical protein